MNAIQKEDKLFVPLEGRIDTNNASEAEKDIIAAIREFDGSELCFDAEKLDYISSAGLRVLMKVRKMIRQPVSIVNVSRDVYDIFDMTGFTELLHVQKAYRRVSVDGCEIIGQGFFGTVYRLDDETIVKVCRGEDSIPMIEREKRMAQKAFVAGIPTAISYDIVRVGEDYGAVFELLKARTFNDLVKTEEKPLETVVRRYSDLLKLVHHTKMEKGAFPSCRDRFMQYLDTIEAALSEEQLSRLRALLADMPDEDTVVHGDIQMKNVMLSGDEAMLIDMDTLGLGNPVFEFAGLYVTYRSFEEDEPGNTMAFLGIPFETADQIWQMLLDDYFSFENGEDRQRVLERIQLVAAIRFLYILMTTDLKNSALGERRIAHTREHIDELLKTVDGLTV